MKEIPRYIRYDLFTDFHDIKGSKLALFNRRLSQVLMSFFNDIYNYFSNFLVYKELIRDFTII
jgi:hypothetical protein